MLITFVSKFAMAFVCGIIMQRSGERKGRADRTLIASIAGALTYVCLYMIKTFIFKHSGSGYPMASMGVVMIEKLIPSLLNAAVAIVAAPLFYHAVLPALRGSGLLKHMQPD